MAGALCAGCKKLPLDISDPDTLKSTGTASFKRPNAGTTCPFCQLAGASMDKPEDRIQWGPTFGLRFDTEGTRFVFLNPPETISPHWSGQPVPDQLVPGLVRKWLTTCEHLHHGQCPPRKGIVKQEENGEGLKILRVIDVTDGRVVEAPRDCRYVALSYVWGTSSLRSPYTDEQVAVWIENGLLTNPFYKDMLPTILAGNGYTHLLHTAETAGALENGLFRDPQRKKEVPRTIRDAMDLVSAIGERYLWVDSLCLIQDDPADMKNGIDHMDLVYEGAIMTIIAAIGDHNNAGLPGLHPGTRKNRQMTVEVRPGMRMGTVGGLFWPLSTTKYMKRGWT